MSYPPDPNNPYSQQPPAPGYGYPQQAPPPAPGYGYPQQAPPPAPGYGAPGGYGIPPQPGPYGNAAQVQQFYAGWGSRVVARIIDAFTIFLIPTVLLNIGYFKMISDTVNSIGAGHIDPVTGEYVAATTTTSSGGGGGLLLGLGALLYVGALLLLAYLQGVKGQSLGQRAVNIRLVREADGQPMGFGMAFVRQICHVVDGFCCVGYLWPLWDAKKQTFADKIMSTVVVKAA
ncbi:RDD family protein [Streptomyces sp. NRRL B-24484]|uniref:RDD family protein n=1 Tax=Streptomyces sp. NRRL B-24484 TaxID=1463833 RepID=UPI0004BE5232|nr:RDD family protein [Streptomyces sp. NRRL B-24484]